MPELIPLKKARSIVLSHIEKLSVVEVDLLDAQGRICAEDLKSDIDNAPFDTVAMDGFAVRTSQIAHASSEAPVKLKVIDEIGAGSFYEGTMADDECLRIMTGAPAPACANAVVKYEIVDVVKGDGKTGSTVAFTQPARDEANIRPAGEEAKAGEVIVHAGELISSAGIGFLASCGLTRVPTYALPRVAIIATGSELVDPDVVPTKGKIRNANSYALAACVRRQGAIASILPICKDDFDTLVDVIKRAVETYDCVLTTGGAASGDYDFIEQVIEKLGDVYLTHINLRPGKAETFGLVQGTPVFGLAGNPAAAFIGYHALVRAALRKMQGFAHLELVEVQARLAVDIRAKKDPRLTLLRATLTIDGQGNRVVEPLKKQSSGLFGPLQRSNALIVVERGDEGLAAGAYVRCVLLDVSEEVVI